MSLLIHESVCGNIAPDGEARIAVFSDTHGLTARFTRAIEMATALPGGLDAVIHLGDMVTDAAVIERAIPGCPCYVIRGNNDYNCGSYPDELVLTVGKARLYASHGHQYSFMSRLSRLSYRAQELCADMALFGHTHCFQQCMDFGVPVVNPGSVTLPRDRSGGSFAIVRVTRRAVTAEIFTLAPANRSCRGV